MAEPKKPNTQHIKHVGLFQGLKQVELDYVTSLVNVTQLEAGRYLFHTGDQAEYLYVLLDGRIKLTQISLEGEQIILHYVTPGEAFGVVAVLSNISYPVTAMTVKDSKVIAWDNHQTKQLMEKFPHIALNALSILAHRIQDFQNRIRELSTERVERRIARALTRLARQTGKKHADGVLIDLPLTRQDLAELSGTTLYSVSRTLTQWEKSGLVKSKRAQVIITNPHGLVTIAEDLPT